MSHLQPRTIFVCNVTVLVLGSQTFICFTSPTSFHAQTFYKICVIRGQYPMWDKGPVATFCTYLATLRVFSTVQSIGASVRITKKELMNEKEEGRLRNLKRLVAPLKFWLWFMNHCTDRQAASSSDIGRWWEDLSGGGSPSVADMWVEAAGRSVSVAEPKHQNIL